MKCKPPYFGFELGYSFLLMITSASLEPYSCRGACGEMVIIVGNGHGETSSTTTFFLMMISTWTFFQAQRTVYSREQWANYNLGYQINKKWRCPWGNGYRRRKWTWRHEFKSWTRLIAFHIALIPLGKVWIQLFSLQLWGNSRAD